MEPDLLRRLRRRGLLSAAEGIPPMLETGPDLPAGTAAILAQHEGRCVYLDSDPVPSCRLQAKGGPALQPSACRHFPRRVLKDARGLFITLSSFCPAAAGLLFDRVPLSIVPAPGSLSLHGEAEGLDATTVLPPLLTDGVLTDHEGYGVWEAELVATFAGPLPVETAVAIAERATEVTLRWRPGGMSLARWTRDAFGAARLDPRTAGGACKWGFHSEAVRKFLAAHGFASWEAYQGGGLAAVPSWLRTCLLTLETAVAHSADSPASLSVPELRAAFRETDRVLFHDAGTVDPLHPTAGARSCARRR